MKAAPRPPTQFGDGVTSAPGNCPERAGARGLQAFAIPFLVSLAKRCVSAGLLLNILRFFDFSVTT